MPESGDRCKQLKATGGYAFTHVGQLTRVDDSAFSVEQAKDILESLRQFLSFARGAACALPINWGRGEDDEIVWRRFQSPIVDPWRRSHLSWIGRGLHTGAILAELFDSFCGIHKDPNHRESLVVALHWYRHCNTQSSGLEGSLVLGMAALDLLGVLIVVDRSGSMSAGRFDGLLGAKKLRKLLEALKLQPEVPQRYEALSRFAKNNDNLDSCQALAELRNGFVHAKEERRRIVFGSDGKAATPGALQLSTLVSRVGVAPLAGISRKPLQPDDGVVGGAGRACTVERAVEATPTPHLRSPTSVIRRVRYAVHPADSTSACSSTVRVAFSCLSGG